MDKERLEKSLVELTSIMEERNIVSLADDTYTNRGINVLEQFEARYPFDGFNQRRLIDDTILISKDLMILTSHLYQLRPYINNPLEEPTVKLHGKVYHTYHQNGYDWFYSTYASCCFEKLYNFWDRIGDRLAVSFDTGLKKFQIGFSRVMEELSKKSMFLENEHFQWLKEFWENDFREFNKIRKDIVHYIQMETKFKDEMARKSDDLDEVRELWEWKRGLPEYFAEHLHKCRDGFWNMVMLERTIPHPMGEDVGEGNESKNQ